MRPFIHHLLLTAALLGSLPGCYTIPGNELPVGPDIDQLPAGLPGIQLDPQQVPGYQEVRSELDRFELSAATRPMTDAQCACLAASRCRLAQVLDAEAANARRQMTRHGRHTPSHLLPPILEDRAAYERNMAAKQALLAYYQLAEVHLQNSVLQESYAELTRVEQTIDGLLEAGVPVDTDRTQLDRHRAELNRQNGQAVVAEAQLTAQLKSLLSEDPFSPERIETTCAIEPRPVGYTLPDAIEIARANDFQLRAMRRVLHGGDVDDLDVARSLLRVASPMLGQQPVKLGFFAKLVAVVGHDDSSQRELRTRKSQLRQLYEARQQQVDLEVAQGVVSVQQQFMNVGIANDVLGSWKRRVSWLQSRRELQQSDYQDVVQARMELLKAKSDLLHNLVLLETEHVKLRATMGLLVQECAGQGSEARWEASPGPCPSPAQLLAPSCR